MEVSKLWISWEQKKQIKLRSIFIFFEVFSFDEDRGLSGNLRI